ncbi:MAG: beta-lactamase family protein [Clostridiales bacterium]|nr:beta-lactamase family protein [Clostridiales bacterium]
MTGFTVITPEQAGVPAAAVRRFAEDLESRHINIHSFVMLRRGKLYAEAYYAPWKPDDKHRMYSSSKTFASMGVGLMIGEGKLSLDDRVTNFFPEYLPETVPEYLAMTTVRDLLMMATPYQANNYGFDDTNWVRTFFDPDSSVSKHRADHRPGTVFQYNTCATVVLTAIVEKLAGMRLTEYMKPRVFDKLGMSPDIWCVERPEGGDWAGSGVMCTPRDLAKFADLIAHDGVYGGEQIIPADYVRAARTKQIDNRITNSVHDEQLGYGYQIWCTRYGGFALNGMGCQVAIGLPNEDAVLAVTGDTQASSVGYHEVLNAYWRNIYPYLASDEPLARDDAADAELGAYLSGRHVLLTEGDMTSPLAGKVSGRKYAFSPNRAGIAEAGFAFSGDEGEMSYVNATGSHKIRFGFGKNVAGEFPETHYYGRKIGQPAGRGYRIVSSAAWGTGYQLLITVYSVDDYLGTLRIQASFSEDGKACTLFMSKAAERFFDEYAGMCEGLEKT